MPASPRNRREMVCRRCTCGQCGAPAVVAFTGKRQFSELVNHNKKVLSLAWVWQCCKAASPGWQAAGTMARSKSRIGSRVGGISCTQGKAKLKNIPLGPQSIRPQACHQPRRPDFSQFRLCCSTPEPGVCGCQFVCSVHAKPSLSISVLTGVAAAAEHGGLGADVDFRCLTHDERRSQGTHLHCTIVQNGWSTRSEGEECRGTYFTARTAGFGDVRMHLSSEIVFPCCGTGAVPGAGGSHRHECGMHNRGAFLSG